VAARRDSKRFRFVSVALVLAVEAFGVSANVDMRFRIGLAVQGALGSATDRGRCVGARGRSGGSAWARGSGASANVDTRVG
jgi:hypothetical protein